MTELLGLNTLYFDSFGNVCTEIVFGCTEIVFGIVFMLSWIRVNALILSSLIFFSHLYNLCLDDTYAYICAHSNVLLQARCKESNLYCGTTALGAFIRDKRLVVFNIGDCHAVLCSHGLAVNMSDAHKPGRADEEARILQARGWVTEERYVHFTTR